MSFAQGGGGSDTTGDFAKKTYYDKMVYDQMLFRKKRNVKHEVGIEVEGIVPAEAEVRLLGNKHRQCRYYSIGVDVCHTAMLQQGADNFLACKKPIDSMWRCYTEEKYGLSISEAPVYAKEHESKFYDCLFREASGMDICMKHFGNMVRSIHRSGESELNTEF